MDEGQVDERMDKKMGTWMGRDEGMEGRMYG